ncbi:DUF1810 domain-containing protein [Stutzerimonas tarimensis]|uniref:DUF1810 domain-containing protein n=1 Tax=Stutzerimonas tarimensis TaxID=1507735 RepID=A0ABV7T7A5_9GAMM
MKDAFVRKGFAMGDDLQRFVQAQRDTYRNALAELNDGGKRSHWMWFVFPQLAGLGHSEMAHRYAIAGLDEARAYLAHPILGPRLEEATRTVLQWSGRSAQQLFGSPDDIKLRSCMTLFAVAAPDQPIFREVLDSFFAGKPDQQTLSRLRQ